MKKMEDYKNKKCPFCGSSNITFSTDDCYYYIDHECQNKNIEIHIYGCATKKSAINEWNSRI